MPALKRLQRIKGLRLNVKVDNVPFDFTGKRVDIALVDRLGGAVAFTFSSVDGTPPYLTLTSGLITFDVPAEDFDLAASTYELDLRISTIGDTDNDSFFYGKGTWIIEQNATPLPIITT
jgi:hypothetical protein